MNQRLFANQRAPPKKTPEKAVAMKKVILIHFDGLSGSLWAMKPTGREEERRWDGSILWEHHRAISVFLQRLNGRILSGHCFLWALLLFGCPGCPQSRHNRRHFSLHQLFATGGTFIWNPPRRPQGTHHWTTTPLECCMQAATAVSPGDYQPART